MNEKIIYLFVILGLLGFFLSISFPHIPLTNAITIFLTAILVGSTLYYASTTKKIAKLTEENIDVVSKSSLARLIVRLREIYARDEMLDGMKRIREWKKKYGEKYLEKYLERKDKPRTSAHQIDKDRRKFSHYLHTIFQLRENKCIDDEFVMKFVEKSTIEFLKEFVNPLEEVLVDAETANKTFNYYYKLYNI